VLIAALSVAIPAVVPASGSRWKEVRGQHFVLWAREDLKEIGEIACDIDRVVNALRGVGTAWQPAVVPAIVAVETERDARELLPQFWEHRAVRPVGAYWQGPYGHHIVVRVNVSARERFRRILHEYAHFNTHLANSEPLPWVDEALSELWTNAAVRAGHVEIGLPVDQHLKTLRSAKSWIPIAQLTSASELPAARDAAKVRLFYAESWALAHYLVVGKGIGLGDLNVATARADLPSDEELQRYLARPRLGTVILKTESALERCVERKSRPLSETESSLLKARMLADGERPDAALPVLRDVLRRERTNADATETLGFVHFTGNRSREAAELFDRLIASGSASFMSYYYRALLAEGVPDRTDGSGRVLVSEYLARAVRLNPDFAPARARLRELDGR
jgi:hypothetical protein